MARTIIKTETPGWFSDPATGKKTRKQDGDTILTLDEYNALTTSEAPSAEVVEAKQNDKAESTAKLREAVKDAVAETVTLTSGKVVTGKTVEIQCAWVDPENRTDAQKKLFEGDPRQISYDAVLKAAGGKTAAKPDGTKRLIKKQDAFQVRFSPENQQKWRAELRRRKNKARREAARAAAKS